MKKSSLIFIFLFGLTSCTYETSKDKEMLSKGFVENRYRDDTTKYVKIGNHDIYLRTLSNGDSLFKSYFVDSEGFRQNEIYYTTGGATNELKWHVQNGKTGHEEYLIQK